MRETPLAEEIGKLIGILGSREANIMLQLLDRIEALEAETKRLKAQVDRHEKLQPNVLDKPLGAW